jgi:leucyl-tRNA synthetase
VQVNGKVRGKITVPAGVTQERIEIEALADPKVAGFLNGKKVQRIVHVAGRLMNIVVEG